MCTGMQQAVVDVRLGGEDRDASLTLGVLIYHDVFPWHRLAIGAQTATANCFKWRADLPLQKVKIRRYIYRTVEALKDSRHFHVVLMLSIPSTWDAILGDRVLFLGSLFWHPNNRYPHPKPRSCPQTPSAISFCSPSSVPTATGSPSVVSRPFAVHP